MSGEEASDESRGKQVRAARGLVQSILEARRDPAILRAIVLQIVILHLCCRAFRPDFWSLPVSSESLDIQTPSGTFETRIDVRWGEMDALRHVNNTAYFRYFEEARVRLFSAMGLDAGSGRYGVLAHASCDFLRPLMYPARVVVGMKLARIGRTSLELDCWIADAEDAGVLHARGRNVLVCADAATGRPQPWTDADRQALERCFAP